MHPTSNERHPAPLGAAIATLSWKSYALAMASLSLSPGSSTESHPEQQFLDLMRRIWSRGSERIDRTGIGTRSIMGAVLRFDLAGGAMPLITTKRVYWKTATRELLWFLTGSTNIRPAGAPRGENLERVAARALCPRNGGRAHARGFRRADRRRRGFRSRNGAISDPVYGKQWVAWATYRPLENGLFERGEGINQVAEVVRLAAREPGQPAAYHRGVECRRARADGAAAVPQDLSVPCC